MTNEYDWKVARDAVSDTEAVDSTFHAAIDILHLFIQGQREVLGLSWNLSGSWADIESGQACTMDVVADVVFRVLSDELLPDDVQKVAVVFDQAGVAGNEEDQDAFVGRIRCWRRDGIFNLIGADHRK